MKKRIEFLLLVGFMLTTFGYSFAQERSTSKNLTVYVTKLQASADKLNLFLALNEATIYRTDYNTNRYFLQFSIPINRLGALDSLAAKMGYITQNSFNSQNLTEKIANLEKRNKQLEAENLLLQKQLKDTSLPDYSINDIKRRLSNNNQTLTNNESNLNQLRQNSLESSCYVEFTLNDELSTPNNTRISFVNMPGVEYGYLSIENPKVGVSAKAYQGASVKYMFTRGKSYFNLGVYRAVQNNAADSNAFRELFLVNFGQDFYPKNFGRGKRKFLNLYTGYQLGGFVANSNNDRNSKFTYNANLSIGLELLKTKHVLIDNKVSYFLPLSDLNRNLRGLLYQASFNFVF